MKYIVILSILLLQLSFSYEYTETVKASAIYGCLKAGGSRKFCICQEAAIEKTIPQSELVNFQKSIMSIYRGGSPENLPDLHIKAMQRMGQCVGL